MSEQNVYVPQVHDFVIMTPGFFASSVEADRLPVPILHHTGKHVWIPAIYSDDFPEDVVQVGDGRDNGYDQDGNKVVSVPVRYVVRYMDETEAEQWAQAAAADASLLRYAK